MLAAWLLLTLTAVSGDDVTDVARRYLGFPYSWGAQGEGGFDCSGYVRTVYGEVGYQLPRTSREQAGVGEPVSGELLAGDLVFFADSGGGERIGHVGIYVGDGEFIHAASGKGEVTYDRLAARYYAERFRGARRLLSLAAGDYDASDAEDGRGPDEPDTIAGLIAEADPSLRTEHRPEDRPPQLAPARLIPPPATPGPRLLRPEATAVGLRLGAGGMGGEPGLMLSPEVSFFGHESALFVALAAPLPLVDAGGQWAPRTTVRRAWDTPREWSRVVQELRFGHPGSDRHLELSRTAAATLGPGLVVRGYTPGLDAPGLPDFVLDPGPLTATFAVRGRGAGAQGFVDDALEPNVMGLSLSARAEPVLPASLSVGWAVDRLADEAAAPGARGGVHGLGLALEVDALRTQRLALTAHAGPTALVAHDRAGFGGAAGARLSLAPRPTHLLTLELEAQLSGPGHVPTYFDAAYALDRRATRQGLPKAVALRAASRTTAAGAYGELSYTWQRRVALGLAYADGVRHDPDGPPLGRSLSAFLQLHELYVTRSRRPVSLRLGYLARGFERRLAPRTLLGDGTQVYAAATLELASHAALGASLRRSSDGPLERWEAMASLTLGMEL